MKTNRVSRRRAQSARYALSAIALAAAARPILAQTTNFTAASGSWYDAANWDAGVPTVSSTADINNAGNVLISDASLTANTNFLITGAATGNSGIITMSDGTLMTVSDIRIGGTGLSGGSGTGTMIQSAGTVIVGTVGNMNLGFSSTNAGVNNGFGTYLMSGGTLTVASSGAAIVGIAIGNGGSGYFRQTGGLVQANAAPSSGIGLGRRGGSVSSGTYELQNGTVNVNVLAVGGSIAAASSGQGTFIQSGGAVYVNTTLNIGTSSTLSNGRYLMSGGSLNLLGSAPLIISYRGNGTFTQTGGIVNAGSVLIGNDATVASSGTYNLNGGQLNATTIDFGGGTAAAVRLFSQSNGTLVTNYLKLPANGTFSYSGGLGTSVGTIALAGGKFRSSANLSLASNVTATAAGAAFDVTAGELTLSGPLTNAGGTLTKTGAGSLTISGAQSNAVNSTVTVSAGVENLNSDGGSELTINANSTTNFGSTQHLKAVNVGPLVTASVTAGADKVLVTKSLALDGGAAPNARLDLNDNDLVIDYPNGGPSPFVTVQAQITSAFAGAAWTGNGITSTSAAARSTSAHPTALGYAEASELFTSFPATFSGESVDADSVLVRYTLYGDANMDGAVDSVDFNNLASNFSQAGKDWSQGDFNYDGSVDTTDFNFLAKNFAETEAGSSIGALVPEPAAGLSAMLLSALFATRKRGRARR